jgi:hypothetical protein
MRKLLAALAVAASLVILCACASSGGHAAAARSSLSAVAKDPAVIRAEQQAKAQVITPCLDQSKSVSSLIACFKTKVPRDKRVALGKCLIKAKLNGATIHDLETTAGAQCVAAALPPLNPASPSTTPAAIQTGGDV